MAYQRAASAVNENYKKLQEAVKSGDVGTLYVFTGEESYLREFYLRELRRVLVAPGFEEFNYHRCEGKELTARRLAEMAESLPMMAERTLIVVNDWELFKLGEEQREQFMELIGDFPPYCCLVLNCDISPYKPDRTQKKLCDAMKAFSVVEFKAQERSDLIRWITRRFKAQNKEIDAVTAEHLIFTCGSLMNGLITEIEKIGSYAKGARVTKADIDAIADPVLDAVVFHMTDAISKGEFDRAAELLGSLLKQQEDPIMLLAVMGNELRRLYSARLAIDGGKDKAWLMELWGMKSDYPARLLMDAARRVTTPWCRDSLLLAQQLDRRMKGGGGVSVDGAEELKLLLMRLAQGARA